MVYTRAGTHVRRMSPKPARPAYSPDRYRPISNGHGPTTATAPATKARTDLVWWQHVGEITCVVFSFVALYMLVYSFSPPTHPPEPSPPPTWRLRPAWPLWG